MNEKIQARMVRSYFDQGEQYMSESQEVMVPIKDMHPAHAANAAARLLADAKTWANEAAITGTPARYVLMSDLFQALTARAAGETTAPAADSAPVIDVVTCEGCSYKTTRVGQMVDHARVTGHAWH